MGRGGTGVITAAMGLFGILFILLPYLLLKHVFIGVRLLLLYAWAFIRAVHAYRKQKRQLRREAEQGPPRPVMTGIIHPNTYQKTPGPRDWAPKE